MWEVRSGIAFLGRRWRVRRGREGAKQGTRFWLSLCKHGDCFIDSSFLAGKEAKEAGGTYDGSPSTPFQRPTGALPLSVDPAQWDGVDVSRPVEVEKRRASDVPPSRYCCVGVVLGKVSVSSEVLVFG